MPPKHKHKAAKAAPITPVKQAAATSGHKRKISSTLPGTGARTSRLLPSEPLHMQTRRAVKTASNQNSSGAPSIASFSSRRSSFNDLAQFEDGLSEVGDERPTKRSRLSTGSGSPELTTDSLPGQDTVNGSQVAESTEITSQNAPEAAKVTPKKRRASDGSTGSSKTAGTSRENGLLTREQSDISEQPRRKKRRTTTQTPADADQPPELTDASTAPNSPEQIPDVDSSQNLHHVLPANGDGPAKTGRRLPGRRRAPHADINVETDLRRQLNLKMSYRSLAKVQKGILEELSKRTVSSLENDPQFHKQCPEYECVMAALEQHKQSRLAQVEALRREKLAQLERVTAAEEHIAKEKYIQRFHDLQEDLLLQCFYRLKQLQRESGKMDDGAGTEDEDNIVPPARFAFPPLGGVDDRVGSQYASRSRAYVETERLLDEELSKKQFGHTLGHFIVGDGDADKSITERPTPTGFATFAGPDRTEAIAHQNIMSLLNAADDVESAPVPPPRVIPNQDADALFLLASLSADAPHGVVATTEHHQPEPSASAVIDATQGRPTDLNRIMTSPVVPPNEGTTTVPSTDQKAPAEVAHQYQGDVLQQRTAEEMAGIPPVKEQIAPFKDAPVRNTHRIMDMLNNDTDVSPVRPRYSEVSLAAQIPADMGTTRVGASQITAPSRTVTFGLSTILHQHDVQPERNTSVPQTEMPLAREAYSSPVSSRVRTEMPPQSTSYIRPLSLEELRRRDPRHMLREMLNAKDKTSDMNSPGKNSENIGNPQRERSQMTAPPPLLSRPFSPPGISEKMDHGKESQRPLNTYNVSPSMAPLSYHQSPSTAPAYLPRQGSQDPGSSMWERDRRLSGSQGPQSYTGSPQQSKTGPSHHSPFSGPSGPATQLPSISQSLPSKQSGQSPSGPINYRFAHYDPAPAPPRSTYQPSQSSYPSSSHAPPPSQYPSTYSGQSYLGGYAPPQSSFQGPPPPPPPTTTTNASTPYPPLKIHQYGGQPILPANVAQHGGQPILPATMAPPPQSQAPSSTFVGQTAPAPLSAYSPPQQHTLSPRNPSYDANDQREPSSEHVPEPGSGPVRQPRRQYRSYHAPGSQFRPYNGPRRTT